MSDKNMTKCKACGKDIAKGVKKCVHCGKDQRNFFKRHKILTGVLAIVLITFLAAALGGDDDEKAPKKTDTPVVVEKDNDEQAEEADDVEKQEAENEEELLDNEEFNVGDKVEFSGQIVEITKVEKSKGSDFDKPSEGKEYVIVHVSIENNSDKEISYNPFNFKMKNSNGQIETQSFTMVDSDTSLSSGDLAPGGNVSGTIAFEQPIDDEALQLFFEPGFWDDKRLIFNL